MKRKNYLKPTMMVVKLQHTGMLMTSETVEDRVEVRDYEWSNDGEE
jgi:hypothetical protein